MHLEPFTLPVTVRDHQSFREWARSPACPEKLRIGFIRDTLRIDLAREDFYTENQVRGALLATLHALDPKHDRGLLVTLGVLWTNLDAEFSTLPDLYYVSHDVFESGRVREVPEGVGCMELVGTPEMVAEIVSDSTEFRDTIEFRDLYYRAGVREYWLIDARPEVPRFDLMTGGPDGYRVTPDENGWQRSGVFERWVRIARDTDPVGDPEFSFEVK